MDQTRALNALAPFLALAKSATAPRAAADLITQATSAPNTYIFAELLHQPNIQALAGQEQYGGHHELLKVFAWGTWGSYHATDNLPQLSDAQATKLRLLSLLTLAAQHPTVASTESHLSYASLCANLDLAHPIDLEHLVTQAIYNDLLTGTLNPATQTVVITSVAPLRDLAPGSISTMMAELAAWSGRCEGVLADLEHEIQVVRAEARKRAAREGRAERQVRGVTEAGEKGGSGGGGGGSGVLGTSRSGHNTRGNKRADDDDEAGDAMEVDGGGGGGGGASLTGGGGKKRTGGGGGGGIFGAMGRLGGKSGR
ncbi:hypothetical protein LTR36_006190 [Oleoguttula mirabilis]|uniref:PCI domain-containing protein n=1 Tax=Oleoguttula mirabilis TaxID=1507867 RepID=A0AAV9JDA5_9PEZI|nr:hypothetical protein LTR36_006190 [Oleoguttula mirabilis]